MPSALKVTATAPAPTALEFSSLGELGTVTSSSFRPSDPAAAKTVLPDMASPLTLTMPRFRAPLATGAAVLLLQSNRRTWPSVCATQIMLPTTSTLVMPTKPALVTDIGEAVWGMLATGFIAVV